MSRNNAGAAQGPGGGSAGRKLTKGDPMGHQTSHHPDPTRHPMGWLVERRQGGGSRRPGAGRFASGLGCCHAQAFPPFGLHTEGDCLQQCCRRQGHWQRGEMEMDQDAGS
jgi:hypothetical protein